MVKIKEIVGRGDAEDEVNLIEDFMEQDDDDSSEEESPSMINMQTVISCSVEQGWGTKDNVRKKMNSKKKADKTSILKKKIQDKIAILRKERKAPEKMDKDKESPGKGKDKKSKKKGKKTSDKKTTQKTPEKKKTPKKTSKESKKNRKQKKMSAKKEAKKSVRKYQLKMTKLVHKGRQPLINRDSD